VILGNTQPKLVLGLLAISLLAGASYFWRTSEPAITLRPDSPARSQSLPGLRPGTFGSPGDPNPEPSRRYTDSAGHPREPSPESVLPRVTENNSGSPPGSPPRANAEGGTESESPPPTRRVDRNAFDDSALEKLGMDPDRIDEIFALWANPIPGRIDAIASDAERAEFFRELDPEEEAAVRARLGEDGYDAVLYATGKNNRLVVTSVPENTPGWDAGLLPGDQIIRLDDERIFTRIALNWKESELPRSGPTSLVLLRDGELVEVQVEGGRVRVMLEGRRFPPDLP